MKQRLKALGFILLFCASADSAAPEDSKAALQQEAKQVFAKRRAECVQAPLNEENPREVRQARHACEQALLTEIEMSIIESELSEMRDLMCAKDANGNACAPESKLATTYETLCHLQCRQIFPASDPNQTGSCSPAKTCQFLRKDLRKFFESGSRCYTGALKGGPKGIEKAGNGLRALYRYPFDLSKSVSTLAVELWQKGFQDVFLRSVSDSADSVKSAAKIPAELLKLIEEERARMQCMSEEEALEYSCYLGSIAATEAIAGGGTGLAVRYTAKKFLITTGAARMMESPETRSSALEQSFSSSLRETRGLDGPLIPPRKLDSNSVRIDANTRVGPGLKNKVVPIARGRFKDQFGVFIESFTEQPKWMRNLIMDLSRKSHIDSVTRSREYAALVVELKDGTRKTIRMTSSDMETVRDIEFDKAKLGSDIENYIADNSSQIARIHHFHTHPDPEVYFRRMMRDRGVEGPVPPSVRDAANLVEHNMTSSDDVKGYIGLVMQIESLAGRQIPFNGVVIPHCTDCFDTLFVFDAAAAKLD